MTNERHINGKLPPEAVVDEKQLAELIGWPVEVFRAAVKTGLYGPPSLIYKGKPLWLARLQHINALRGTTDE